MSGSIRAQIICGTILAFALLFGPKPDAEPIDGVLDTPRTVNVTWTLNSSFPPEVLDLDPGIRIQVLVDSSADPQCPVAEQGWQYIESLATYWTTPSVNVDSHWSAMVMSGSQQVAVWESNRLYKISWAGHVVDNIPWDETTVNVIAQQMQCEYIGEPPVF